jgi:hypothetical protein
MMMANKPFTYKMLLSETVLDQIDGLKLDNDVRNNHQTERYKHYVISIFVPNPEQIINNSNTYYYYSVQNKVFY